MSQPVIVEAVRTVTGRRNGYLSEVSAPHLLASAQYGLLERAGLDPGQVDQLIGGCVTQAGMQAINVTRIAWLSRGANSSAAATTIDCQCGSGLQANNLMAGLIATGGAKVGIACGVEHMTKVPLRTALEAGDTRPRDLYWPWPREASSQFEGAERIAEARGLARDSLDEVGARSQSLAAAAWADGAFDSQLVDVLRPGTDAEGPTEWTPVRNARDETIRATSLEDLAGLRPILEGGKHTAGSASPVSDGAAAVLWMAEEAAGELGFRPRARIAFHTMVGTDPYYYLDGPVEVTAKVLSESPFSLDDFDLIECNEAFASVLLSFQQVYDIDWSKLNVNGGAIALGHPVGATGCRLLVSALHELERRDGELAYITMCQGGSLGIGTVLQRLR